MSDFNQLLDARSGKYSDGSSYGYTPSPAWAIVFIVIFSLSGRESAHFLISI